ncbi:MAG: methyltransferase domain-containing protein [Bacteroidetes bacterium]|nr:methyltransferase domain-containing protein [Bacteroidota bacterium]MBU1579461.1 methyltransferase domain-containing protein [Bacteroidota bacterium]MBU2557973.1 methyltransferase domain-containing protein [Bacteroidota bacterium]
MEYDRIKWNEKHTNKQGLHQADAFLQRHLSLLKAGKALDIACGRGRNALLLAENGFETIGVDYSDVGLEILQQCARQKNLKITTFEADLDQPAVLQEYGPFDSIICINFKPLPDLLQLIPELLVKNGIFIWCSFNEIQALKTPFPIEKALTHLTFFNYFKGLETQIYERFTDETGERDGYVFQKK